MNHLIRLCLILIFLPTAPIAASELLFDGDFESGNLAGWSPGESGSAITTRQGRCFSSQDTRGISIRGRYAGLLRGNGASLTSKPFLAGRNIQFLALSENRQIPAPQQPPLALEVTILDAYNKPLGNYRLSTAVAMLTPGCPSSRADYRFSRHYISTQAWLGQQISIRFSQHTDTAQYGGFTLVDEVEMTAPGETSALDLPIAEAGLASDPNTGQPYLVAIHAEYASSGARGLQYSWLINGEKKERPYFNPCLGDLPAGQYTANLYIRKNGILLASDTLNFSLPAYSGDLDVESACNLSGTPVQTPDSNTEQAIP